MTWDVIVVGGGLGGSALATALRRQGRTVLVLERESRFRDRVRGENMLPWGVDVARRLGLLDDLVAAGAHLPPFFSLYVEGRPTSRRNLPATTPSGLASLDMFHPDLQTTLLERAEREGAEVRRGVIVDGSTSPVRPRRASTSSRAARVGARLRACEFPDPAGLGPFGPSDERARRLVLGLES